MKSIRQIHSTWIPNVSGKLSIYYMDIYFNVMPHTNLENINLSLHGFIFRQCFFHAVFCVQLRVFTLINIPAHNTIVQHYSIVSYKLDILTQSLTYKVWPTFTNISVILMEQKSGSNSVTVALYLPCITDNPVMAKHRSKSHIYYWFPPQMHVHMLATGLHMLAVMWCLEALPRLDAASMCNFHCLGLEPRSQVICLGLAGALRH